MRTNSKRFETDRSNRCALGPAAQAQRWQSRESAYDSRPVTSSMKRVYELERELAADPQQVALAQALQMVTKSTALLCCTMMALSPMKGSTRTRGKTRSFCSASESTHRLCFRRTQGSQRGWLPCSSAGPVERRSYLYYGYRSIWRFK